MRSVVALLLFVFAANPSLAQNTEPVIPDPLVSLGQPARWRMAGGVMGGYAWDADAGAYRGFFNVTPEGRMPNLGIDLVSVEGAARVIDGKWGAEVGNYIRIPYLRLGLEYDFEERAVEWVTSLQFAWRRGGLFHVGDELRLDYRGRNKELLFGIVFNTTLRKYRATRPFSKTTPTPEGAIPHPPKPIAKNGLPKELEQSVSEVEHAVEWMDLLLTPRFFFKDIEERAIVYRDHIRMPGHSFIDEDARYHRELRHAFTLAVGDETVGNQLAVEAERIIFEQIVAPYDGMFGEGKEPWQPRGFIENAVVVFDDLLAEHGRFSLMTTEAADGPRDLAREVFRRTVAAIEAAAEAGHDRWKTEKAFWTQEARLVWLPLNYGLLPEQYDSQAEWNEITERLTAQKFTRTNDIKYMMNERFHPELLRMINETEVYHVLLIHDFTGWNADGSPDPYGWGMVAKGYMHALTKAVREIDAGKRRRLPQFMLFIDQNFYQLNGSRNIVTYMENLFTADAKIDDGDVKKMVDAAQHELITTVMASKTFGGMKEDELEKLFKVNVTVTNRWDPTFAWDIDKRDHRKLTFRDVFEDDPSRGEGILTGTGVGHHYQPPTWEDRALGIRGPALISLKRTAEKLCRSQGYKEKEIPEYLLPRPFPSDYEEQCQKLWDRGWRSNMMVIFNDTGYGEKKATVQRAVMYNLAPKKSVLLAIDSLWLSDFWSGMYISAALRGAHVYAIAPSPANAPASANFTLFLMQRNLKLLVSARHYLEEDLAKVDGQIYTGLYNHDYGVDDVVARASAFLENTDMKPFILEDFPMHPDVFKLYQGFVERWKEVTDSLGISRAGSNEQGEVKPYLHMKTQFFATDAGLDILRQDEWLPIVRRWGEIRGRELLGLPTEGLTPMALVENMDPKSDKAQLRIDYERYLEEKRPADAHTAMMVFTIGSMNQDRRGMLSDGEVLAVCSGYTGLIGVLDMFGTAVTTTWVDTVEQLDTMFPEPSMSTRMKRIARYLQDFF
jgi:hypothetical protein